MNSGNIHIDRIKAEGKQEQHTNTERRKEKEQ
jgi:hypothetical protein